jgi:hypothetical protein
LQTHLQYRFAQNDRDTVVAVAVIAAEPTDEYRQGIEDLDIPSVDYVHEYTLKSAAAA